MATALDVITGSLRLLGKLQSGEVPTAAEGADALTTMNQMLHAWRDQGIDLEHSDYALSDPIPLQENHLAAIRYALTMELAAEYGVAPSPFLMAKADEYFRGLQAFYADPGLLGCDYGLNVVHQSTGA